MHVLFDHKMVSAVFQLNTRKRGSDYWKFNSALLNDDSYCKNLKHVIKEVILSYKDRINKKIFGNSQKLKLKSLSLHIVKINKKCEIKRLKNCRKK